LVLVVQQLDLSVSMPLAMLDLLLLLARLSVLVAVLVILVAPAAHRTVAQAVEVVPQPLHKPVAQERAIKVSMVEIHNAHHLHLSEAVAVAVQIRQAQTPHQQPVATAEMVFRLASTAQRQTELAVEAVQALAHLQTAPAV
jgi:hypothetical protein